jgi:hypothetical protein
MVRIELIPLSRNHAALVAPSEEATTKMNFLQACAVKKTHELAHQSSIKMVIILVFRSIDKIKNHRWGAKAPIGGGAAPLALPRTPLYPNLWTAHKQS